MGDSFLEVPRTWRRLGRGLSRRDNCLVAWHEMLTSLGPSGTNNIRARQNPFPLLMLVRMRKLSPLFFAAIVVFGTTALKAQTLKFAEESFSLSSKDSDGQKIENDFLLPGETETNWTQKLVISRFPRATDVSTFANNLCLTINTQRPGTGASVSNFGADCYVAYSTASALGGQLSMVHRILVDPQGGVRMYVFVQRPSGSKEGANQATVSRDDSIRALGRLSPLIHLTQ